MQATEKGLNESQQWGEKFFRLRDYTALPLVALLLMAAKPTVLSATVGVFLIMMGGLIRIHVVAFLGDIARSRGTSMPDHLITSGPYAIVRNPLYIGNFLLVLGFGIYGGKPWLSVLALILFAAQSRFIIDYEEVLLEEKFGNDYIAYKSQIPAWLPRKFPRLDDWIWPEGGYSKAIRCERRTISAILAVLTLLLILSPR